MRLPLINHYYIHRFFLLVKDIYKINSNIKKLEKMFNLSYDELFNKVFISIYESQNVNIHLMLISFIYQEIF